MTLSYFDMLSGDPIQIRGVGKIRSPKLRELGPSGVGLNAYRLYVALLSWGKDDMIKYLSAAGMKSAHILNDDNLSSFDIVAIVPAMQSLYESALSFFVVGKATWDADDMSFCINDPDGEATGSIFRDNFDELRKMMLQLNYLGLDSDSSPVRHSSESSKALWERAQEFLQKTSKKESGADKPEYHLSNIISKLCTVHPTYNLFNIYDLTIFQLYDQFFQYGYIKRSNLDERIFSIHGGEKFKPQEWLSPLLKNI